ncbi:type II toxin-antitoxin system HigB family toxin [Francisella philomiragia]|uniref:type II toxin-antitoxin system HigB family toxin n=1 Tax=Francisella philomiragia TaxID=28110 RepID=UPI00190466DD|nr:type II toxin-antitoxin system HigB family toxin [Francisella philomiragia]MBK2025366.1 type II toxin-antitoxin system HigB family toxin [Francisella philomiragia]
MHIISKKKLRDYYQNNAQSKIPLSEWYYKMKHSNVSNIIELKEIFNSVDPAHGYTIFNVGGNNYRIITAIHYNFQRCYIRAIWTHAEYSKKESQEKIRRGEL